MAVTLYAENEVRDIRRIEQGVGQGFRFERGSVPSAEQVMSLAGTVAREQIKGVSDEMVEFFRESAQELLEEEESEVRGWGWVPGDSVVVCCGCGWRRAAGKVSTYVKLYIFCAFGGRSGVERLCTRAACCDSTPSAAKHGDKASIKKNGWAFLNAAAPVAPAAPVPCPRPHNRVGVRVRVHHRTRNFCWPSAWPPSPARPTSR